MRIRGLGRQAEADADFDERLRSRATNVFLVERGQFHTELGRLDKAAADFVRALESGPTVPTGMLNSQCGLPGTVRHSVHFCQGHRAPAKRRRSLPGPVPARTPEGRHGTKEFDDYERAAELKPGDLKLRLERGLCLAHLGRWNEAASDYAKGLESNPGGVDVWYQAAMAQLAAGKTEGYGAHLLCACWTDLARL